MPVLTDVREFMKGQKDAKIIDYNNPNCINCNDCCSMGTMITQEEYSTIKKHMKKKIKIYEDAVYRIHKYSKNNTVYWMCPFSNSYNRCSIYDIRPKICRDFHCTEALQSPEYNLEEYMQSNTRTIYDLFKHVMSVKATFKRVRR